MSNLVNMEMGSSIQSRNNSNLARSEEFAAALTGAMAGGIVGAIIGFPIIGGVFGAGVAYRIMVKVNKNPDAQVSELAEEEDRSLARTKSVNTEVKQFQNNLKKQEKDSATDQKMIVTHFNRKQFGSATRKKSCGVSYAG